MSGFKNCRGCFTEVRCAELGRCLDASSAQAPVETAGPVSSLARARGSLPAAEAEALCVAWELECTRLNVWRNHAIEKDQHDWSTRYGEIIDAYSRCVKDLRREMSRAKSRQPEENTLHEPHP